MVKKGCPIYLCAIEVAKTEEPYPGKIPVVQKFLGVFQEVSGLSPDREIEFMTKLIPGTASISKAPYRMAITELAELKTEL